jgi:hypothetical protein
MQRVRLEALRLRNLPGDSVFDVFGDLGTGVVDTERPLTPRPIALFPEFTPRQGHLRDGWLSDRHLDGVDPDGHVEADHLKSEHFQPAAGRFFDTPGYVFGRFLHEVNVTDGAGNTSVAESFAVTVNAAPTRPECVQRTGYDAEQDVVTFAFAPSRFAPIRGA